MKLHGYWRSSTSYRARIALNLKGVDYDYVPVNLLEGEQRGEAYRTINPHGTVPLLDTGTEQLTQSLAIIDWLEETYPEPSFLPDSVVDHPLCRDLYYAVATELHAPLNLAVLKYLKGEFSADQDAIEAFYAHIVTRTFEPVEARLAAHDWNSDLPFGRPGLLEIVLLPQLYNARRFDVPLSAFPHILRIEDAALALDAFKTAYPDTQKDVA